MSDGNSGSNPGDDRGSQPGGSAGGRTDAALDELGAHAKALLERLAREREELELKMHLAKADLRDEWQAIEARYKDFEQRVRAGAASAVESSSDVGAALRTVGDELANAYRKVRKAME